MAETNTDRTKVLDERPPFSASPSVPPEPTSRYLAVLQASSDWVARHRLVVPLSLGLLIGLSTLLAYRSQTLDSETSLQPDGPSSSPSATAVAAGPKIDTDSSETEGTETSRRNPTETTEALQPADSASPTTRVTRTTQTEPEDRTSTTEPATTSSTTTNSSTSAPSTSATTTSTTDPTTITTTVASPTTTTRPTTTTARPTTTTTRPTTEPPPPVPGPNELANSGFENPRVDDGQYRIVSPTGWASSSGSMEIWGTGHNNIDAHGGRQFAELNVRDATTISQQIAVTPGATYEWSFAHRGRTDNDTVTVMLDGKVLLTATSGAGSWNTIEGTVVIAQGTESVTFALQARDQGGSGNLIDRATFRRVANP